MRQEQSIQVAFVKPDNKAKLEHKIRLKASIEVVRLLLNQGLAFCGHREDESSLNKGNFLEILSWYAKRCDKISDLVLKKAPKNNQLTSHKIQKDIITACKLETIKAIMEDLNGDYFSLLLNESCDVSRKEQMAIVLVFKKCLPVGELVLLVSNVLNAVGASFKSMDELGEYQAEKVQEALDMGEVETGKGLNQELGLARATDTRCGSHYKFFKKFISMFFSITDVLHTIVVDSECVEDSCKATGYLRVCQTFEIAFILHLMKDILAITNELNESLQKKEQDIANSMLLVKVAKKRLQCLREEGWDPLIKNVSAFCVKYDIWIPNFDEFYIIDWQLQELNDRFNEEKTDLLIKVACLNPVDSFSSFDINKILRMVELYPDDFGEDIMVTLKNQLETYIVDVRDVDERFSNLKGLGDLSKELVKAKKHLNYPLVFRLVKFALLRPVATATVERVFLAMKLIKTELRNRMDDDFMSGCMVPYVEKYIFKTVSDESIMNKFQKMKTHRIQLDNGGILFDGQTSKEDSVAHKLYWNDILNPLGENPESATDGLKGISMGGRWDEDVR
ncbi:uncharacterized protein LOC132631472 [Lycium barbarum]|uniref:uncharacterized protein LOC132631472 n=1 Tax=Lycium barbarum TaxID=112863 RepID=UPI00293EE332|nr:uncharacterized protein LOC132631472 [Lycium barbarum]